MVLLVTSHAYSFESWILLSSGAFECDEDVPADGPQVHEVTVASSCTGVLFILSAGCFTEVCHRAELYLDGSATIKATLQSLKRCCSPLLIGELDVHAANHVICQVVTDVQVLNLTKLGKLLKDVLIKVLSHDKYCNTCLCDNKYYTGVW